ncbi:PREDICTED: erythroid membrane-associated protein-like [Chrysochloris asiatica]|uniref:Erythroid membrane-associated protein-like n=1 Tax=Chrysochloris asiatica TaxID=185453 RepID=A0A9B0U8W8_CHRAS|nr:PREDICTED: erythroid membrane-associated protein-like [Chrysochloris asiatica]
MNAQGMEVRWFRDQISFVVHMYQDGQDHMEFQRKEYQGRTEFLKENITQGYVALKLHDIHPLDEGYYGCMIRTLSFYSEARFLLQVAGVGSSPHIHLEGDEVQGIRLLCTSSGWYPEPKVQWTASSGQQVLPSSEIKQQMASGLFYVKTAIIVLSHLEGKLNEDLGIIKARCYAEDITLDIDTAHPYLQISEDKKSVKGGDTFKELPKCQKRFDNLVCVLGQQTFLEGRHYWEVSVKEKVKWTLGICKDSICRRGEIQVFPESGFWTLCLNTENNYQALENPPVTLQIEEVPEIIGIFLDYKAGRISFYNVTNLTHMYTFRTRFTGDLRPYFYPGPLRGGSNRHPLTILSSGDI